MAVAASIGGATPNFDGLYAEVARLSRKLSVPSPREFFDPGQTLKLEVENLATGNVETYDTYVRAFYDKQGDDPLYKLYYKNALNQEVEVSDGAMSQLNSNGTTEFRLNGQTLQNSHALTLDINNGQIIHAADGSIDLPRNDEVILGVLKLDAVSGLDVALLNERISKVNLVIEALNKVLIVGTGNAQAGIDLRV